MIQITDKYESDAPTTHTRVEADTWPSDCIYGECGHGIAADVDAERPFDACPSSKEIVCQECSEWHSEYEGGVEPWPCENQAVQEWQALGGVERQYDTIVEAFLRGWREHAQRSEVEAERDYLRERQESADLANEAIRQKRRAINAEQERDAYAAVIAEVRTLLPGPRTFAESLARDHAGNLWPRTVDADEVTRILAPAPDDILTARDRRVASEALREAADDLHHFTEVGNMFGGYDCSCGDPWYTDGCAVGNALLARADQIENGSLKS